MTNILLSIQQEKHRFSGIKNIGTHVDLIKNN